MFGRSVVLIVRRLPRESNDMAQHGRCYGRGRQPAAPEKRHPRTNARGCQSVFFGRPVQTSLTFFSGRLRTGLPVAAWMALSTAGATTQMVGSPTPPQKS